MAAFDHQPPVTIEQLRDTPSRADGISLEDETKLRAEFSAFLADVGQECHISVFAIYTASIYFHMFYVRQSFRRFNTEDMVLACLLLSSKVMDTKRRMNDILDAYYKIKALQTKSFVIPVKESEPYDAARQRVYDREYDLIVTIEFNFTVHRPYDLLANKLKEIFGPKFANESEATVQRIISEPGNLYQASWFYVNDSCRTPLALTHNADVLSTLAIHLAIMHKKVVVRNHKVPAGQPHKPWHEELYNKDLKFLEELGLQLLEQIKKKNDKQKMDKLGDKMGKPADKLQSQKKRKAPDGEIESSTGGTLTQALEPGQIPSSGSSSSSSNSSNAMVTMGDHKKEHRKHDHHHKHRSKGHHGGNGQGHGQHGQQSQGHHGQPNPRPGQQPGQLPGQQQQGQGQGQQHHRKSGSSGHGGHKHDKHGSGHKKNKHHHGHGHSRPHKPTSHSNPPPPGTHPSGPQGSHKAHRERGSGDRRHNKRQRIGEPGKPPQHQERLVHVDPDGSTHPLSDVKSSDSFPLSNATGGAAPLGQMQSQVAPSAVSSDSGSAMVVDSVAGLLSAANASTLLADSTLSNAVNANSVSANGSSSAAASTSMQSSVMENKGESSVQSQTEGAGSTSSNSNSTGSLAMTDEKSGFEVEMEEGEIGSGSDSDGGDDHSRSRSRSMSPEPHMAEMQDGETKMLDDSMLSSAAGHVSHTDDPSEPFEGRSMPNGDPSTPETFMPDLGGEEKQPSFVLAPPSSEPPMAGAASAVEAVLVSAPEAAAQAAEMLYDSNGSNGNNGHDGHANGHANGNGHHMNGNADTNGHHAMDEVVPVPQTKNAGWQGSPTKDKQQQSVVIQEVAEHGSGLVNHEPELADLDKAVHANGLLNGHGTNGHGPFEGPEAVQPPKQPPLDQPMQA